MKLLRNFSFCIVLSSCAISNEINHNKESEPTQIREEAVKDPVSLEMTQAYVGDRILYLKIILDTKDILESKNVVIAIKTRDGEKIKEEQYQRLSDIIPNELTIIGSKTAVYFQTSIDGITDFDIVCYYGEEGKKVVAESIENSLMDESPKPAIIEAPEPKLATIEEKIEEKSEKYSDPHLENIELIEETVGNNKKLGISGYLVLPVSFVRAEDKNRELKMAFSLVYVPDGKVPAIPADNEKKRIEEDELDFTNYIKDGEVKDGNVKIPFEVNVGKTVPNIKGGRFVPYVRLLKSNL